MGRAARTPERLAGRPDGRPTTRRSERLTIAVAAGLLLAAIATGSWPQPASAQPDPDGTNAAGATPPPAATAAGGATSSYTPLPPCRLADQRIGQNLRWVAPGTARVETDRCGIPAGATAVVVTTTIVASPLAGWLIAHPAGAERPTAATLTWDPWMIRSNGATVALGDGGAIEVYKSDGYANGAVVIDVVGAFVPAPSSRSGRFVPDPTGARLLDTRVDTGHDGRPLASGSTVTLGLPETVPDDATALAVTITAVGVRSPGFVTAMAAGDELPLAAVLTTDRRGQTRTASTIVPVDADGLAVHVEGSTHLVVDTTGYFTGPDADDSSAGLFVPVGPRRLRDTRPEVAPLYPNGTIEIPIPSEVAPADATISGATVNLALVRPRLAGHVTAHPARAERGPVASGYGLAGELTSQFALVPASPHGIEVFAAGETELTVDLTGLFVGPPVEATEPAPAPNPVRRQRVFVIGDSILAGVYRNHATGALRGAFFELRPYSCRRLVSASCQGNTGGYPPTTLQSIDSLPRDSFDVLVVMGGYNDGRTTIANDVPTIHAAARRAGFRRVVWLTHAREAGEKGSPGKLTYEFHNAVIRAHAAAHADFASFEWGAIARQRPNWTYSDGTHLQRAGGYGAADFISRAVARTTGQPCPLPHVPGGPLDPVCPDPGFLPPIEPATLYDMSAGSSPCVETANETVCWIEG